MADIEKNVRTEEGTDAKELPKRSPLTKLTKKQEKR